MKKKLFSWVDYFEQQVKDDRNKNDDIVLLFVMINSDAEAEVIEEVYGLLKEHRPKVAKTIVQKLINSNLLGD